ncbi:hypothetical protein ANN_07557 [Periplaneta americana]|uniref:Uncharacterized protein n=1 Tax=Periplaneta americana TaxID=6978 RepID=A0ABQ8SZL0_PERAM|nr:hypothetical protein ANN_07557 [Periplaneta americana]
MHKAFGVDYGNVNLAKRIYEEQHPQRHIPELLEDVPINIRRNTLFQHNGAPAHFGSNCLNYLNVHFPNRRIGRAGPVAWSARSPDMNPVDSCVWGHSKSIVYETPMDTTEELVARIILSFDDLRNRPQIFRKIRRSIKRRYTLCSNSGGRNFEQFLLFVNTIFLIYLVLNKNLLRNHRKKFQLHTEPRPQIVSSTELLSIVRSRNMFAFSSDERAFSIESYFRTGAAERTDGPFQRYVTSSSVSLEPLVILTLRCALVDVDEPREFNLPTSPKRRNTYMQEKLPTKYGVHSEEYLPIRTVISASPVSWNFVPQEFFNKLVNLLSRLKCHRPGTWDRTRNLEHRRPALYRPRYTGLLFSFNDTVSTMSFSIDRIGDGELIFWERFAKYYITFALLLRKISERIQPGNLMLKGGPSCVIEPDTRFADE